MYIIYKYCMIIIQQKINIYIYISECFSIWFVEVICVLPPCPVDLHSSVNTHEQVTFKSACFLN